MRGQRAMEALKSLGAPMAMVIRNGESSTIRASELVPGDVVTMEAGAIVPVVAYAPTFNALFKTVPLRVEELPSRIGAAVIILAVVETEKWARRRRSVTG